MGSICGFIAAPTKPNHCWPHLSVPRRCNLQRWRPSYPHQKPGPRHRIQQLYVQAVRLTPTHHQKARKHDLWKRGDIDRHFDVWRGHDGMQLTTSVQLLRLFRRFRLPRRCQVPQDLDCPHARILLDVLRPDVPLTPRRLFFFFSVFCVRLQMGETV